MLTGTLTSGSESVTGLSSTSNLNVGDVVIGTGIPFGTYISAINSSSSITLSQNATTGGSQSLTFDATAFNVDLNGTTAGTGYDQLQNSSSGGNLGSGVEPLNVAIGPSFSGTAGTNYVIVSTAGSISGNFLNLTNGTVFSSDGQTFKIQYNVTGLGFGGSNDDVVLTYEGPSSVTLSASTVAGDTAMTSGNDVTVTYTSEGVVQSGVALYDGHTVTTEVDAGTTVTYTSTSSGSTGTHRWATNTTSYTVSSSTTSIANTYYEQYSETFGRRWRPAETRCRTPTT